MRSSIFFSALLCLFPVLISGHPMMSRRDDPSSNSTSNSNSTLLPPTDGSNATTSDPSDGSSNSTSSDPTGGSTNSSVTTDPIALELMSLILQLNQNFYDAAINVSNSNDLNNPTAAALFGMAQVLNGKDYELLNLTDTPANCTFELKELVDRNVVDLVASAAHLNAITLMAAQAILQNTSISVSDADQDGLAATIADASTLFEELGNVVATGVPLSAVPQLTLADVGNLIRNFNPTCDSPTLLLDSLPSTNTSGFTTPYILNFGENLIVTNPKCASPNATAFCQVISDDPTANATVTPVGDCVIGTKSGTVLVYITDSDTPLPSDPQERVGLQSEICVGPDFFIVLNDVN